MDRFSSFNPKATLLFFFAQIAIVILIFNPILLTVSFVSSCAYKIILNGFKAIKYITLFVLPIIIFVALFNMVFTHYGMTVLFTVNQINFTFESLFYGLSQGLMLTTVLLWFNIYSQQITSEGFISVFGRLTPNLALLFSMSLSFIPKLRENAKQIADAQMLININENRIKRSISNFSALLTLTLEQSVETADSMKARGFGRNRSVYSKYRFSLNDFILIIAELSMFAVLIVYKSLGYLNFIYEPVITFKFPPILAVIIYAVFSLLPIIIDLAENIKWHFLKQKI